MFTLARSGITPEVNGIQITTPSGCETMTVKLRMVMTVNLFADYVYLCIGSTTYALHFPYSIARPIYDEHIERTIFCSMLILNKSKC